MILFDGAVAATIYGAAVDRSIPGLGTVGTVTARKKSYGFDRRTTWITG